jgi:DNA-directed RNA polymerase subunit K/omega
MTEEKQFKFTKYEKARMLGSRALQIAMGAPFLVNLTDKDLKKISYSPIEIAKIEFEKGIIPITVKRPLPKRRIEKE